jgi:hypothetical protein
MNVAVYTCITNSYDSLSLPRYINSKLDYYCFNDGSIDVCEPWVSVRLNDIQNPKDANRKLKLLPHQNDILKTYDITIYIDGSIEIVSDLNFIIDYIVNTEGHTFIYEHKYRNCIYDECIECYLSNKISLSSCRKMLAFLLNENVPPKIGLFEATILIRKSKNLECINLMNHWWDNYINSFGVRRDQIALMYTLWCNKLNVSTLGLPDYHYGNLNFKSKNNHTNSGLKSFYNWWVRRPGLKTLLKFKILKLDKD